MGIISKLKNALGLNSNRATRPQEDYSPSIPQEPAAEDDSTDSSITEAEPQEPDTTVPDETPSEPVDSIKGIGPSYAKKLGEAGVNTVDDLAGAEPETLAEQTGIAESRIQNWIDQAS